MPSTTRSMQKRMVPSESRLEFYRSLLDPADFDQLLQAIQRPLVPAIRINTLKTRVQQALATWPGRYGWQVEPVPYCSTGWRIVGGRDLARTPEHKLGSYYIQEAASMLPAELFRLEGEPLVLDLAAAPGGKTTHLVSRLGDRGLVVANDSSSSRIAPLRANLQDWGATNTAIANYRGEVWGGWFPETFDRVLLDAPCSGESLRTAERRRSRPVSDRERKALRAQQVRLLVSGFHALKPGGELVYATCTLHPDEDEAVLEELLSRYPKSVEVASAAHVIRSPAAPALLTDGVRQFDPAVQRAVRLWPHLYDTAGFFAALLRKRESIPAHPQRRPSRPLSERGFRPAQPRVRAELMSSLHQQYGFDLEAVAQRQSLALWERGRQLFALPETYLALLGDLPVVAAGMLLAEREGDSLVPSHELVSRFGASFSGGRLSISAEEGKRWLRGYDLRGRSPPDVPRGSVVVIEDQAGRILGRGKVLGNRIRNLLPRRLVY